MSDMLVKLYGLPDLQPALSQVKEKGVEVRQAHGWERPRILEWVRDHFSIQVADACDVALSGLVPRCYIAVESAGARDAASSYDLHPEVLVGVACYDAVARGMFGPEGVRADRRGRGIGTALLLSCLHRMVAEGYAYAIVGWAGPSLFYEKCVRATIIEGSEPGIYRGPLTGRALP